MNILSAIEEIIPTRNFNMSYIIFDSLFLIFLVVLLVVKKKYLTLLWALFGGILYFAVDFGIFYSLTHTRSIYINGNLLDAGGHALVLLWLSLSYGIPNFIFIWMALSKDKYFWLFTLLIVGWWVVLPTLSQFGSMDCFKETWFGSAIKTERLTNNFHWVMGAFLVVGYGALITYFIIKDKEHLKNHIKLILMLNLIGIACQFSWEAPLLLNGIRPYNDKSIQTLIVNSLIETNSGMVYFFLFHFWLTKKIGVTEDLKIVKQDNVKLIDEKFFVKKA